MPTNITRGNNAQFIVQFLDQSGDVVIATSASITLYYSVGGSTNSQTIDLTAISGNKWTATWSSAGVDLGPVDWEVDSSETVNPAQIGQLRIIDP